MRNAVLAGLMASVVCGVMGVVIIEKKLVMMSGGIAHTSYGGVGLDIFWGLSRSSAHSRFPCSLPLALAQSSTAAWRTRT